MAQMTFFEWAVLILLMSILGALWKIGDSLKLMDDLRGYLQQISVETEIVRRIAEKK